MRWLAFGISVLAAVPVPANQLDRSTALHTLLERAGEQVERYFTRAQSLVCLEVAHLRPLTSGWSTEGRSRRRNL